jgi:hypothetical protein
MKKVEHIYQSKQHFESGLNPEIRVVDEYDTRVGNVPEWVKKLKPIRKGDKADANYLAIPLDIIYHDPKGQPVFVGIETKIPIERQT